MVAEAEGLLQQLGFVQLRVRCHGEIAGLEIAPEEMPRILDTVIMKNIHDKLKSMGFHYVTLDCRATEPEVLMKRLTWRDKYG